MFLVSTSPKETFYLNSAVSILKKKWIRILIRTLSADNPLDISISNLKYICNYEKVQHDRHDQQLQVKHTDIEHLF